MSWDVGQSRLFHCYDSRMAEDRPVSSDDPAVPSDDSSDGDVPYERPDAERPASVAPTEPQLHANAIPLEYAPAPPVHDPYAALRYKDYRLFTIGWMTAVVGFQITEVAIGWEIYDRLHTVDPAQAKLALGWLGGIQAIPLIILALPAGVLADIFDRRRLIQLFTALGSLCAMTLAYLSYRPGSIPLMFVTILIYAAVLTLGRPARNALLPQLVPTRVFSNAITWNASAFQVASMVGPAVGGLLISRSLHHFGSLGAAYMLDAVCSLLFVAIMFRLPKPRFAHMQDRHTAPRESALRKLSGGIRFVLNKRIILATLTLDLFAVLLGGAVYLLPVFAKDILHVGSVGFGWLRAAEAIGAFTMAMLVAHLPPMKHAGRAMLLAVAAFGVATIIFGLSRWYWLSFLMVFCIGAFDNISVVVRHTLVQVLTPDSMRGRVSAVNNIFIGASNQVGGLESGLTAWWLGAVRSVVYGGLGTILAVVSLAYAFPQLRRFGSLQDAVPPDPETEALLLAGTAVKK